MQLMSWLIQLAHFTYSIFSLTFFLFLTIQSVWNLINIGNQSSIVKYKTKLYLYKNKLHFLSSSYNFPKANGWRLVLQGMVELWAARFKRRKTILIWQKILNKTRVSRTYKCIISSIWGKASSLRSLILAHGFSSFFVDLKRIIGYKVDCWCHCN